MINKYIKISKIIIIVLITLLIVVSYSFGKTYSNFIYNSENQRAVEMFTNKLKYISDNKNTVLKPGNNLVHFKIRSLNNVDSFYKIAYKNDNINVSYYNKTDYNIIKSNDTIDIDLLIFNATNESVVFDYDIVGGYITNEYSDIVVSSNYKEINSSVNIGDKIKINDINFTLLRINEDGSYELISDVVDLITLNGSSGYNKSISLLNNNSSYVETKIYRSVNLSDLNKYTNTNIVEYDSSFYLSNAFYPLLWKYEDSIINNIKNDNPISNEEEVLVSEDYIESESITVKKIKINNIEFKNEKYKEIFMNSNYFLATRFSDANSLVAEFGIISINENKLQLNKLYDSNNNSYEVKNNSRIYTVIDCKENLFLNN